MPQPDTHKTLKRIADILSCIFVAFMFFVAPIWSAYEPYSNDASGKVLMKLIVAGVLPAGMGVIWLTFRHSFAIQNKYPFANTLGFKLGLMSIGSLIALLILSFRS
jgi:hypothetical protein